MLEPHLERPGHMQADRLIRSDLSPAAVSTTALKIA